MSNYQKAFDVAMKCDHVKSNIDPQFEDITCWDCTMKIVTLVEESDTELAQLRATVATLTAQVEAQAAQLEQAQELIESAVYNMPAYPYPIEALDWIAANSALLANRES